MLDLPRVALLESTTSTLDVAHQLAGDGAPAGTLVIANEQTAGRGRGGKRAGILVEARWREQAVEWVAIGLGVNVKAPDNIETAAALDVGTSRLDVLLELVPAIRIAARSSGPLLIEEMEEFDARDIARGRVCVEPALGRVAGITPTGELLVALADSVAPFRSGSLVLQDAQ